MYQKFDSKLIRCLGTYFSIEICQLINVRINYFLFFIIILIFLLFINNCSQISTNSSNVVFSIKIPGNL